MLSITLEPQYEQEWQGDSPSKATFPPCEGKRPLYHQIRTYRSEKPLIINTYNTGTGKTKAALLRLLKRARDIGGVNYAYLDKETDNVLLIAPTNELLNQHAEDAEQFCEENHLPYRVLILSRAKLDEYMSDPHFSEAHLRRGASLHYILDNPRRIDDDRNKKATLIVVNPDIFYYALYFRYHRLDGWPLFRNFLTLFNYIIIDEFHYYNPKQLANFLFFMSLSKHMGYIEGSTKRQFCILTATPNPDVQTYLGPGETGCVSTRTAGGA